MNETILSKENSKVLRGLAITAIALHNYFHILGFSAENEMTFSLDNTSHFFEVCFSGHFFAEMFSFLGWLGVPVFIFLTGFGVASKTPVSRDNSISYIKRNYLKLLALMLPAVLFYAGLDIIKGDLWPSLLKRFSYLTMLTNFAYPYLRCNPGVYWYFGLTFQFYLLWALFGRRFNSKNLLLWSVVFMLGLFILCSIKIPAILTVDTASILSVYRHCFTGWFCVFALGVWFAQTNIMQNIKTNLWLELIVLVVTGLLVAQMNRLLIAWMFLPFVALIFFIVLGMLVQRIKPICSVFHWIGGISAFIFVCHPIARTIVNSFVLPYIRILFVNVVLYLLVTILIALCYRWLCQRIISKIIK